MLCVICGVVVINDFLVENLGKFYKSDDFVICLSILFFVRYVDINVFSCEKID